MDTKVLVDRDIEEGKMLVRAIDNSQLKLDAALWFYFTDSNEWRLLLASSLVDTQGPKRYYAVIQSILHDMQQGFGISLERISVLSPRDNLIQLLRLAIRTDNAISEIRFDHNSINGVFIEDALIYRLC